MQRILFFLILTCLLKCGTGYSQCNSASGINQGMLSVSTSWQTVTNVSAGYYYTFTGNACDSYTFTFCSNGGASTWDTQITITDLSGNPIAGGFNDDFCGLQSEISFMPVTTATYRVFITLYSCLISGGTGATLAFQYVPANTVSGNFALVGNASAASASCSQVTANVPNQKGCAWDNNSTLNFGSGFSYDFIINFGNNPNGADGMTFTIQNDPRGRCACGGAGDQLGASGITNSLITEIDTYLNSNDRDDNIPGVLCAGGPNPDHLDIWLNGVIDPPGSSCPTPAGARIIPAAVPLMNGAATYSVKNGLDHIFRIFWVTGSNTFTAILMDATGSIVYGSVSHSFNPLVVFGTNTPFFGFTGSTGAQSNQQVICYPLSLLPVELTSFTANCIKENVLVNWETASEHNNAYFVIESSTDGIHFNAATKIISKGDHTENVIYTWTDPTVFSGIKYYRLRQTDYDGKTKVFPVVGVKSCFNEPSKITGIFPNPFDHTFQIGLWLGENSDVSISVTNVLGNVISTIFSMHLDRGVHTLPIAFDDPTEAVYFVSVKIRDAVFVQKIIRD